MAPRKEAVSWDEPGRQEMAPCHQTVEGVEHSNSQRPAPELDNGVGEELNPYEVDLVEMVVGEQDRDIRVQRFPPW